MVGLATASQRPNLHYDLTNPATGITYTCPPTGWRYERKRMKELIENNEVLFPSKPDGRPRRKKFAKDLLSNYAGLSTVLRTVFNTQATRELKALFDGEDYFDFPKPVEYLKLIVEQGVVDDGIILDFFSGSATTAHAVMQLNAEDGGNRKFIMVQLPEKTDKKSEAFKAGYSNICEIGKERIRRAAKKIAEEYPDANFDGGFRVLKIDSTNMKDVYYKPSDYSQEMLTGLETNIKEDRSDLDLLFGCLTDWGIPLSMPLRSEKIGACTIHNYNDGDLIACFDKDVPDEVFEAIAQMKPLRAVFRDSCFESCPSKINITEIFKNTTPDTEIRVL